VFLMRLVIGEGESFAQKRGAEVGKKKKKTK
jgi:hypothetical protein